MKYYLYIALSAVFMTMIYSCSQPEEQTSDAEPMAQEEAGSIQRVEDIPSREDSFADGRRLKEDEEPQQPQMTMEREANMKQQYLDRQTETRGTLGPGDIKEAEWEELDPTITAYWEMMDKQNAIVKFHRGMDESSSRAQEIVRKYRVKKTSATTDNNVRVVRWELPTSDRETMEALLDDVRANYQDIIYNIEPMTLPEEK